MRADPNLLHWQRVDVREGTARSSEETREGDADGMVLCVVGLACGMERDREEERKGKRKRKESERRTRNGAICVVWVASVCMN